MIDSYGISIKVAPAAEFEATLDQVRRAGFQTVQLGIKAPHKAPGTGELLADPTPFSALLERYEVSPVVAHPGIYLAKKPEEMVPRREIGNLALLAAAAGLGAEYVVVHPNIMGGNNYAAENEQTHRERGKWFLEQMSEHTAAFGLKMAVENIPRRYYLRPDQHRPGTAMADVMDMIADLPDHVGVCLDTSHACNNGLDPADEARIAGSRLFCLHLSDADGPPDAEMAADLPPHAGVCLDRHWLPGKGIVDWPGLLAALAEIGFAGPRAFELIAEEGQTEAVWRQAFSLAQQWSR